MYRIFPDVQEYKEHNIKRLRNSVKKLKIIYIILSTLSLLAVLAGSIITALLVSKLIYAQYPIWFFFLTAGISAGTTLISNILSYFVVQEKLAKVKKQLNDIDAEEVLYNNKLHEKYKGKNRDIAYYLSIATILDSIAASKEVNYE